jgi:DNA-binding response OmpR family regulator
MVHVLILSLDTTLAGLLRLNLERRGFGVRHQVWAACCGVGQATAEAADALIADLDCPPPAWWNGTRRVRALFPSHPLLLLGHDWPDGQMVEACRPCRYLQKPFAIDEFLQALGALVSGEG